MYHTYIENTFYYKISIFKMIVHVEWMMLQWQCAFLQIEATFPAVTQSPFSLFHPSFPALLRLHSIETVAPTAAEF